MNANKRGPEESNDSNKRPKLEVCPHLEKCYRRNPHHFKEYDHPHLKPYLERSDEPDFPSTFPQDRKVYLEQLKVLRELNHIKPVAPAPSSSKPGSSNNRKPVKTTNYVPGMSVKSTTTMQERLSAAAPYNVFFTKVPKAVRTLEAYNSISLHDLLCPSLGTLASSLQINFMIDVMWLMEQYQIHNCEKKPMTVLYGYEFPSMKEYMNLKLKNVKHHMVNMKDPFGTHHSKIGIYAYENGDIRIVVSTANLYYEDWNHYNQSLWISPPCPKMDDGKQDYECPGPTGFKTTLIKYLNSYNLPLLNEWIHMVKRADFSDVKVALIASIPGKHYPKDVGSHIHQVGDLLSKHCSLPPKTTPESEGPLSWGIIAQASSIGSLGKSAGEWLRKVLLRSLASHKQSPLPNNSNATLNVIFPSADNVMYSHFGAEGGGCLPYSKMVNEKQKWLQEYLHQWKADSTGRSRAMPHVKSYCRVSPCLTKLAWFLLTSSNISKSAWGSGIQKDFGCYVRSYEIGVLFLPHFFDEDYFCIGDDAEKRFPFMYDLPLTPYTSKDEPCNLTKQTPDTSRTISTCLVEECHSEFARRLTTRLY